MGVYFADLKIDRQTVPVIGGSPGANPSNFGVELERVQRPAEIINCRSMAACTPTALVLRAD